MYEDAGISEAKQGVREKTKLFVQEQNKTQTHIIQIVADIIGADLEIEVTKEKSKAFDGSFPFLETSDGSIVCQTEAIAKHIARMNLAAGLVGKTNFENAKMNEWIAWTQINWIPAMHRASCMIYGHEKVDMQVYNNDVKTMKDAAKVLDKYLKGKNWINNDTFTLADIFVGSNMIPAF